MIAALEANLGAPLICQTSRGLKLTAAGKDVYAYAICILSDLEEAELLIARTRSTRYTRHWTRSCSYAADFLTIIDEYSTFRL